MFKKVLSAAFLFASLALASSAFVAYAAPPENASDRAVQTSAGNADASPAGQVRACEARMANVQTRSQNMVHTANTLMSRIEAIETRVEEFYQNRVLAAGYEVENFNDLKAQIQAKQRVVEMNIVQAEKTAESFNCNNDPKGQVSQFGNSMREVVRSINEYRTAVRNMLVAVHRVSLGVENE